jgi:hypothetical protein
MLALFTSLLTANSMLLMVNAQSDCATSGFADTSIVAGSTFDIEQPSGAVCVDDPACSAFSRIGTMTVIDSCSFSVCFTSTNLVIVDL